MTSIKVSKFSGDIPKRGGAGRTREATPFDGLVADGLASGQVLIAKGVDEPGSPERSAVVKQLRKAAKYGEASVDIWPDYEDGVLFKFVPLRKRNRSGGA